MKPWSGQKPFKQHINQWAMLLSPHFCNWLLFLIEKLVPQLLGAMLVMITVVVNENRSVKPLYQICSWEHKNQKTKSAEENLQSNK